MSATDLPEKIAVIGLGYVGLPLALAFSKHSEVVGVEQNATRVAQLQSGIDANREVADGQVTDLPNLVFSTDIKMAREATVFIVTVQTPIDDKSQPDLSSLIAATTDVGGVLKKGDMVVFESTVCPGTTENICIPILQKTSQLSINTDFTCAYSPERVSPGGGKPLTEVVKVVAGSNADAQARAQRLYGAIIPAGLHAAPSIAVAEAAKITENIQRDVDIAITNELAMIFKQMNIDSEAVFNAAATKWNFRRFYPGLVGGHCIGVDSYYLLEHAQRQGYSAAVLAAARQANNAVPLFIANAAKRLLADADGNTDANSTANLSGNPTTNLSGKKVLILGYSFKENCPDVRNTLVELIRQDLIAAGCDVTVCDPIADAALAQQQSGVRITTDVTATLQQPFDLIVFAVAHDVFRTITTEQLGAARVLDVKGIAPRADWRL